MYFGRVSKGQEKDKQRARIGNLKGPSLVSVKHVSFTLPFEECFSVREP